MDRINNASILLWGQFITLKSNFATCLFVAVIVAFINQTNAASVEFNVDQEFKTHSPGLSLSPVKNEPLGQEFSPAKPELDTVELYLLNKENDRRRRALVIVNIRLLQIEGKVIGTSEPVFVEDGTDGPINFDFASPIQLKENITYIIELVHLSGPEVAWRGSEKDGYSEGRLIDNGFPSKDGDLWFRVGMNSK